MDKPTDRQKEAMQRYFHLRREMETKAAARRASTAAVRVAKAKEAEKKKQKMVQEKG